MKNPKFLITHAGRFHADDVCAGAILSTLFPDASILRTRDERIIQSHADISIIFDVGRSYDPERGLFDHHMNGAATRENGVIYSSFGLVWKHFGHAYLERIGVDLSLRKTTFERFDAEVVLPIDMLDTGSLSPSEIGVSAGVSLGALVDGFNPAFDEVGADMRDTRYEIALSTVSEMLTHSAMAIESQLRAEITIEKEINSQWGDPVLELKHAIDAQPVIDRFEARHVLLIVQPSSSGGYGLTVARKCAGSYDNVVDLPAAWAGLSGAELVNVTGVAEATFCHSARFFAAADDYSAILRLAYMALADIQASPEPGI